MNQTPRNLKDLVAYYIVMHLRLCRYAYFAMHLEKKGSTAANLNKGNAKTAGNNKKGRSLQPQRQTLFQPERPSVTANIRSAESQFRSDMPSNLQHKRNETSSNMPSISNDQDSPFYDENDRIPEDRYGNRSADTPSFTSFDIAVDSFVDPYSDSLLGTRLVNVT